MAMIDEIVTDDRPQTQYFIDETWFSENGYSFPEILRARVPASLKARLDEEVEERHTVMDKKSGKVKFEISKTRLGDNLPRAIREYAAHERDYISPDMPTLEAIFRVLLAGGNQPMSLEEIRDQLAEWCPGGGCQWLLLPMDALERLVSRDMFYGIRPFFGALDD
jgi:hypothetical protein